MKTSQDPRHKKRIQVMQDLFAWDFHQKGKVLEKESKEIISFLPQIDDEIKKAAPTWPIGQINRIDLSILRLAVFELIIKKTASFKVIVDEAVELAKEFGATSSPSFINGVLGKVISKHGLDKKESEV